MNALCSLIVLTIGFSPLEFLDRAAIVENNVATVTVSISKPGESKGSCLTERYEFDDRGNLVLYSPPLVGSDLYFNYDESDEVTEFGRVDSDGVRTALPAVDVELLPTYENDRVPADAPQERILASACFNIDATYEFVHEASEHGLPDSAVAKKKEDRRLDSPDTLHVTYTYETRSALRNNLE